MNYKILILSNKENDEHIEDIYLAESLKKDGNIVDLAWVDYDEQLDEKYDVIIRRNTWVEEFEQIERFAKLNKLLEDRLEKKNIKTVNLVGLDGKGKKYLIEFMKKGFSVIPTFDNVEDALNKTNSNEYILKMEDSYGSGLGQLVVKKEKLVEEFKEGYLIQPKLKFKSEIQSYFVGNKLMYVFEYIPSKYPNYPDPISITLTEEQKNIACSIANESGLKVGFQRIDFIRLENDDLLLLEIEDNSPHMSLEELDENFRDKVLEEYKKVLYEYIEN